MKRISVSAAILTLLLSLSTTSWAGLYTYVPSPADLNDLDHYKAYAWGLNWTHPQERIIGASLTFYNIYDWEAESNDILWVNLLNTPPLIGVKTYTDDQNPGNYFAGWDKTLIGTWTDPVGGLPKDTITFTFNEPALAAFRSYVADGKFGLGIDPDCHYYNDRVRLSIATSNTAIPEPATMVLVGLGLAGVGIIRRKR